MPTGDVKPADCNRGKQKLSSLEHQPCHQLPATLPKDPMPIEPGVGLDTKAFLAMPKSERLGIGVVQGYSQNPKKLPIGVPAQQRGSQG